MYILSFMDKPIAAFKKLSDAEEMALSLKEEYEYETFLYFLTRTFTFEERAKLPAMKSKTKAEYETGVLKSAIEKASFDGSLRFYEVQTIKYFS